MRECPPGFRLYAPVLERIGDWRPEAGGVTFRCLFPDRHSHGDRNWSGRCWVGVRGELVALCMACKAGWREFAAATGTRPSDWWPKPLERRMDGPKPQAVKDYPYRDRDGALVAVKARWEPGFDGRAKSFTWKRPVTRQDILDNLCAQGVPKGAEVWAVGADSLKEGTFRGEAGQRGRWYFRKTGTDRCPASGPSTHLPACQLPDLYRLPELLAADPARMVLVAEGEKDCDRLAALGFVAVCGPHGSDRWSAEMAGWLCDRHVAVLPHCDGPGVEVALSVLAGCVAARAASVRWADVPNPADRPGYDVSDWLGGLPDAKAKQMVADLVKGSPAYTRGK